MIRFIDILILCFRNFYENKNRTFLTLFGIIIGIFVFVFFLFISFGLSFAIENQFSSFGTNVITISSTQKESGGPSGSNIVESDIKEVEKIAKDYNYVSASRFQSFLVEYKNVKESFLVLSYRDWELVLDDFGFETSSGRNIADEDRGKIVFGAKATEKFFDDKPIGILENVYINDNKFKVVGVLKERGDLFVDNTIYISNFDMKRLSEDDGFTNIRVSYYDDSNLKSEIERFDLKLNSKNLEKFSFSTPNDSIKTFNSIINMLTFVILFIVTISIVVSFVNILNTMHSNVIQRKNQISTMKAIGATNSDVIKIFLLESFLYGLIGSLIGFIIAFSLAYLVGFIITNFLGYKFLIEFNSYLFIGIVLITCIFSTIFGTYPAIVASKTNPSKNLNDD